MHPIVKSFAQQLNFLLGRNPRLVKQKNWREFIPEPYKAVVILSADFELAWAWRYSKMSHNPLEKALSKAKSERENMPKILEVCEQYNIPITWLTVGHLFLESCTKENGIPHPEILRLPKFENNWWKFDTEDWFADDPCTNYKTDPLWYCPDLIEMILHSSVHHEIGCHTFSHIDCRDSICTPEIFKSEIEACERASNRLKIPKMRSFVHPGHTIGNLIQLENLGFTSYRTDNYNTIGFPSRDVNTSLWRFNTTLELYYRQNWSVRAQIYLYINTLKRSIRNNAISYFWFHPSFSPDFVNKILPSLFEWIDKNREELLVITIGDYVDWLNNNNFKETNE
jgi:peptidoglycan/xylan/chitin deacetylase (PgdA/CDA1 family)